jgi:hypothetical protein
MTISTTSFDNDADRRRRIVQDILPRFCGNSGQALSTIGDSPEEFPIVQCIGAERAGGDAASIAVNDDFLDKVFHVRQYGEASPNCKREISRWLNRNHCAMV